MSIKDKYKIISIDKKLTYEWFLNKHYAKRIPGVILFTFGIYEDKILKGVCSYGLPPSPDLCKGICGIEFKDIVLELNRLCVDEDLEKNALSYFVGQTLKLLPKPKIIVSYADSSQHHHGYIYQATNWIYTGLSAKMRDKYDKDNPHLHLRTLTSKKNVNINYGYRDRARKHRYVYFIGNKKEVKLFNSKLNYNVKPYPKGKNKRYDASYKTSNQEDLFI